MVCKILIAFGVFLTFARCHTSKITYEVLNCSYLENHFQQGYTTKITVYLKKSYTFPQKVPCEKSVMCESSIHEVGLHTLDCYSTQLKRGIHPFISVFYLKLVNGKGPDDYSVVYEDGSLTGRTATLKNINGITVYEEKNEQGTVVEYWCATDMEIPDAATKKNLDITCVGMETIDTIHC